MKLGLFLTLLPESLTLARFILASIDSLTQQDDQFVAKGAYLVSPKTW